MLKKLAPYENPKKEKSLALQEASHAGDIDAVAFLYPLSNPKEALTDMDKRQKKLANTGFVFNSALLGAFIKSEKDKDVLQKAVFGGELSRAAPEDRKTGEPKRRAPRKM